MPNTIYVPNTYYDPTVIQKFADKLYSYANTVIVVSTLAGIAIGAGAGYALGDARTRALYFLVGGGFFGLFGYALGTARAFLLQLQAQLALCQMQIEANTRQSK